MDAFAVSFTDGLIYTDINKKKIFFINHAQKNDSRTQNWVKKTNIVRIVFELDKGLIIVYIIWYKGLR